MTSTAMVALPASRTKRDSGRLTSDVLEGLFAGNPDDRISLADIRDALEDRAFGFLILVLTLPNGVPVPGPPGLSAVLGLPIMLLAAQMVVGRRTPWLPRWLLQRSVRRGDFARVVAKALPTLRRVEKLVRPRVPVMNSAVADRFTGLALLLFSIILSLPIPFANLLPAYAIILIAIGLIQQDGVAILFGMGVGVVSALWGGFIIGAGWTAITSILHSLF